MKARMERKVWTGSTNTRSHQLRHPSLHNDGALSLNGVSIAAAAHAGQRNPNTGDCHPGTLDRHNAVYVLKSPRAQRVGSSHSSPPDMEYDRGCVSPRAPMMRSSVVRTPRGAGLGPGIVPERQSHEKRPSSSPRCGEDQRGTEASLLYSPRRGGVPTAKLSKAGSLSALKSFNESLTKGHVDRGGFIDRAFVPAHPNSSYAARIPADYETFAGSIDKWAAGPGGGVEGMRGHAEGHWQDIHAPDSRPFPAPNKTSLELNLKLLPQSITTTEVSSQFLSCGAARRRPLTARDRYPVPTGNTPRKYALRPHTARTHTSQGSGDHRAPQDDPPLQAQTLMGPVPKEPALADSLSAGSTTHTRKALEVMRGVHARPQTARFPGKKTVENGDTARGLDVQGEKAVMAKRDKLDGLRKSKEAAEDKENEWDRAVFHQEKKSREDGSQRPDQVIGCRSPIVTSQSPRKPDEDYNLQHKHSQKAFATSLPHTAHSEARQRDADKSDEVQRQRAQEKHDFLNKIDGDIALFSKRSKRPTTAPSTALRLKQEMHAKMEMRNQFVTKTFRVMDNDHDGVINAKDMAHGLQILNVPASEQEIQELLADHRTAGRGGQQGMGFQDYARDYKKLRFPSQNPFEGIDVKIPFWKPNARYARKWQGEYGKGAEGGGERIRTKLKWRVPIPPQRDEPARKPPSPRGFVRLENWPMMSTFVPWDPAVPRERPKLQPGEREKYVDSWSKRFARNAKIAVKQHDDLLYRKRVFEEAKESEYLLEKPLFAEPPKEMDRKEDN